MECDPTGATDGLDGTTLLGETESEPFHARGGQIVTTDGLPARLGRYVPLAKIGAGGMGVVYAAYDTELARRVAVKVLPGGGRRWSINAAPRLRREARALARLTHPNVVAIYDVGDAGGTLFVAMELVEGQTLHAWQRESARPWTEVLDAYAQAGEGLAAAHREGLVHRDFKPANAIIDARGRVRVLDFGLAVAPEDSDDLPAEQPDDGVSISARLTATGTILGTPAYMALEQIVGADPDARSDQFSFCVALFEGLYGVRPFVGHTLGDLQIAVGAGEVVPAPVGHRVPAWLHRVVLRGLQANADERWPDMAALLRAIARGRRRLSPRRVALLGAGAAVAVAAGFGAPRAVAADNQCQLAATTAVEGAWSGPQREEIRVAIIGSGLAYATDTWSRVEPGLDRYARQWSEERQATCEAGRGDAAPDNHDQRISCLDGRLAELTALVEVLAKADAAVVARASDAVSRLPSVERCAQAHAEPDDGDHDPAQMADVRAQLARAHAHELAGRYPRGRDIAREVAEQADQVGAPRLIAEAQLRLGMLLERTADYPAAEGALSRAAWLAVESGHDEVAAHAMVQLTGVVGVRQARRADGLAWGRHAHAAVARAGAETRDRARLWNNVGAIHDRAGQIAEAREHYTRALTLLDDPQDALARQLRASTLNNLGNAAARLGNSDQAQAHLEAAVALLESVRGLEHPDVAIMLTNLANVELDRHALDDAERHHLRALEIFERGLGPDHPVVAASLLNLGIVLQSRGEAAQALPLFERALALKQAALGADHHETAIALNNLGEAQRELGQAGAALVSHRRAWSIWSARFDRPHHLLAFAATNLGLDLLADGQPGAAVEQLEQALELRELSQADAALRGITRLGLARAVQAMGTDPDRAHALARAAWNDLDDAPRRFTRERAATRAWLDAHPDPSTATSTNLEAVGNL